MISTSQGQNTFYKYLYHGYDGGRNFWITDGIVISGDTLISAEFALGHGAVGDGSLSFFDRNGTEFTLSPPRDTTFIPDTLKPHGSSKPVKTQSGYLVSFHFGLFEHTLVSGITNYNKKGQLIWYKPTRLKSEPDIAQSNSSFGTLI